VNTLESNRTAHAAGTCETIIGPLQDLTVLGPEGNLGDHETSDRFSLGERLNTTQTGLVAAASFRI